MSCQHGLKHDTGRWEVLAEFSVWECDQGQEDCIDGDKNPSMRGPGLGLVLKKGSKRWEKKEEAGGSSARKTVVGNYRGLKFKSLGKKKNETSMRTEGSKIQVEREEKDEVVRGSGQVDNAVCMQNDQKILSEQSVAQAVAILAMVSWGVLS